MSDRTLSIELLGKTYPIKCSEGQEAELQAAAAYLNAQFKQLGGNNRSGKVAETLLLITALNLSHELIQVKDKLDQQVNQQAPRLQRLIEKLDAFLSQHDEILV